MKATIAFLFPTLYLLSQKKWGMAMITLALFIVGCPLFLFMVLPGILCWVVAGVLAVIAVRRKQNDARLDQHAKKIGEEVRAAMSH